MHGWRAQLKLFVQQNNTLKHLLTGLQLLLWLPPSYWLKCQTPFHWSTAHPITPILLLHNTHSAWSTAHPSLRTLLLAYMHSDWSIATYWVIYHLVGQQLFLVLLPSYG